MYNRSILNSQNLQVQRPYSQYNQNPAQVQRQAVPQTRPYSQYNQNLAQSQRQAVPQIRPYSQYNQNLAQSQRQAVHHPSVLNNPKPFYYYNSSQIIPQKHIVKPSVFPNQNTNINTNLLVSKVLDIPSVDGSRVNLIPFKNDLKQLMKDNKCIIEAINIRTFGAVDIDKDGRIDPKNRENGTFLKAINRLDELKARGINTLHVLPISEIAVKNKLGNGGSVYAPSDYNKISEQYNTPNNALSVKDEMKIFVNECHKRGIRIMVDLPSCAGVDMTETDSKLMLKDRNGKLKVPGTWVDIRMFDPYKDKDTGSINEDLYKMHEQFVDLMHEVGVDGIRADVARAKPDNFWQKLIQYSHDKDPEFGWLAETYTEEDASPMLNVPRDRPEALLKDGFDMIYGQWHILQSTKNNDEFNKYIIDNLEMTHRIPETGKSMIGSFYTHDDRSVMEHGGSLYSKFAAALLTTLPMLNPYYISGFETGDEHQLDIFNYNHKPSGDHPEIRDFIRDIHEMRSKNEDVITKGWYVPLDIKSNKSEAGDDKIFAFARHLPGSKHKKSKTILVLANKDVNARHKATVKIPGLNVRQHLKDQIPPYGAPSNLHVKWNALDVDLAPGRVHVFEIKTPKLANDAQAKYRQNI